MVRIYRVKKRGNRDLIDFERVQDDVRLKELSKLKNSVGGVRGIDLKNKYEKKYEL